MSMFLNQQLRSLEQMIIFSEWVAQAIDMEIFMTIFLEEIAQVV